jgi:hypothetical protein
VALDDLFRTPEPVTGHLAVVEGSGGDTPYGLAALNDEAALVASTPPGARNDALNRATFRMARLIPHELTLATAEAALRQAGRACGLPESEIDVLLRLDGTGGLTQGGAAPRVPDKRDPIPQLHVITEPDPAQLDAFWNARPILTHLHDFAWARHVAPWAVLGYSLARIITATPPAVALPPIVGGHGSLNLFVGIVGKSGAGKGQAGAVAKEAIDVGPITSLSPGSGEGIIHAYVRHTKDGPDQHTQAVMFNVPEIDTLSARSSRQGSTVMSILRSAWSGEQIGSQTADTARRVHVNDHQYRMTMITGIQPGRAGALLDDEDGGTPQRFLWFPATDPTMPDPDQAPAEPAPITVKTNSPVVVNAFGVSPMDVCETAREAIVKDRMARARGQGTDIDGHAMLSRLKAAAGLALLDERRDINDEDWKLAGTIMRVSDATRASVVAHRAAARERENEARGKSQAKQQLVVADTIADTIVPRVSAGILRRLKDKGETAWHDAHRAVAYRDRNYFEEAVAALEKAGQVEQIETESGTILRATEEKA